MMFNGLKFINFEKSTKVLFYILFISTLAILTFLVFSPYIPYSITWKEGTLAPHTVIAPRNLEFQTSLDKQKTAKLRTDRIKSIEKIYSKNTEIDKKILSEVISFFTNVIQYKAELAKNPRLPLPEPLIFLDKSSKKFLVKAREELLNHTEYIIKENVEEILLNGIKTIDEKAIIEHINRNIKILRLSQENVTVITSIILKYLEPNLLYDEQKTQEVIQSEVKAIEPFTTRFKKEQPIIFKDEPVTQIHIEILKHFNMYGLRANLYKFFGILVLLACLLLLVERYMYYFNSQFHNKSKYFMTILLNLIVVVAVARLLQGMHIPAPLNIQFLIPIAFSAITMSFLVSTRISILIGAVLSLIIAIMYQVDLYLFAFLFLSNFVAVFAIYNRYKRSELIKSSYIVGGFNILFLIAIGLLKEVNDPLWYAFNALIAMGNGVISVMFSLAVLPYIEEIFKITTQQGLLEHSNINHPLLKRLMMEAPGTYQHSLMVANLAEAAADAIGADVVLARTGAYFHDVGKMKRPSFYSENQFSGENPHNQLTPRISKLIIASHPKDGVELARKYKVPDVIKKFMIEHHGTTLVSFFYTQALKQEGSETIKEEFRYQGEHPSFKESGIVMLADSVEAAVRSLEKPTIPKIENLIEKIVKDKIQDNQLTDCPLSMREVKIIQDTFIRIFRGIYHNRLDYEEEINNILEQSKTKKITPEKDQPNDRN